LSGGLFGEAVEQGAIEWFVLEFVGDSAGVLLGESVVAFADRFCDVVVYRTAPGRVRLTG
jgi:hypothetical protein